MAGGTGGMAPAGWAMGMNSRVSRSGAASPKPMTMRLSAASGLPLFAAWTTVWSGTSPMRSTPRPSSRLMAAKRPSISCVSVPASASAARRTARSDE